MLSTQVIENPLPYLMLTALLQDEEMGKKWMGALYGYGGWVKLPPVGQPIEVVRLGK